MANTQRTNTNGNGNKSKAIAKDPWADGEEIEAGGALSLREPGDRHEGVYVGSRTVTVKDKKRSIHMFDDGTELWGAADMDRKLERATVGRLTLIERTEATTGSQGKTIVYRVVQRGPVLETKHQIANDDEIPF